MDVKIVCVCVCIGQDCLYCFDVVSWAVDCRECGMY